MTRTGYLLIGIYIAGFIVAAYKLKKECGKLDRDEWITLLILSLMSWIGVICIALGMQFKQAIEEAEEYMEEPPYRDFGKDIQSK